MLDDEDRENEIEQELCGEEERRSGDGEVGGAPGEEEVVDAEHEADEDGHDPELSGEASEGSSLGALEEVRDVNKWD